MEVERSVFITPVQIAEIYVSMRKEERTKTERFLESFGIFEIDKEIGKLSGEIIGEYGKSHSLKMADTLIAAAAKMKGFKLWTFNKKHYPMFDDSEFSN